MKTKITLLIIVLFTTMKLYSQTTQEEYNYITKGYKVQTESGLDMKKGYHFQDITDTWITSGEIQRKCTFKALVRDGQTKPCAILCIYTRSDNGFKDYLCIPTFDSSKEIWDEVFQKFNSYDGTGATTLIWGMAKLASFYAAK